MARLSFGLAGAATLESTASARERDEALLLLRNFEDSGHGWFWSTDAEGRTSYLTAEVANALGARGGGEALSDLFTATSGDSGPIRTLAFLLQRQAKFERVVLGSARSEDRWFSLSGAPQFDAAGQFCGFRGVGLDVTDERRSSRTASELALRDALTGLPNRLRVSQVLESNLTAIALHKRPCAVMLLDLDRFKAVNDTLGHPAGDALLKQVAQRLTRIVGEGEKVFRLGGDEFQVVVRDCADRETLGQLADRLIQMISQPYSIEGSRCIIGASVGIALAPVDGTTADDLTRKADLALYAAKGGGRGRHCFYSEELLKAAEDKRALEGDLRDALANGELEVAFQPIVCARDNIVKGVETLLRWRHPERGMVSPALFVPMAEEANLIQPLGEWTLRKACEDAAKWPGEIRVAVNVSPAQFANQNFPEIVMSALAHSGLAPHRLELEITEGVFLNESADTDAMFAALKGIGVRLALDDFGTGYSSLSYLKNAPFDKIKIDQSFVRQATLEGSRNGAIIAAIVALAQALDMETTAEGIETLDQLELVQALGVSHIQGYIYSKAVFDAELRARLEGGDWVIEPTGPAVQRSLRHSLYRKAGAIFGNHYQAVIIRNLSESGAFIEGLPGLGIGSPFIIDFGGGELVFARVRRLTSRGHGVEFEAPMVIDDGGGLTAQTKVSTYLLGSMGLPGQIKDYPKEQRALGKPLGASIEAVAARLGIDSAGAAARAGGEARGVGLGRGQAAGGQGPMLGLSIVRDGADRRLAADEVARLLAAARNSANPQLKHIVRLLTLTGARQRELLEAQWRDIDLAEGIWRVRDAGAGAPRVVRLSRAAIEAIRAMPRFDDCPHLLANPKTRQPYRSFTASWDTVRKKAGLPHVEIDELRHGARV